mgnify:CR=1 FL=1
MAGYIGTQPVPQATQTRDAFTSTNNQTSFPTSGYTPEFLDVFLNGVKLAAADYTATNGSDVVLAVGATTGDILEVVSYGTFEVLNPTFDGNVTFTGNASFGDNDKAIFGAGSDLQIYHDGSHSYVDDQGTGQLRLRGTTQIQFLSGANDYMATMANDGAVTLYYDNAAKIATTATGVDVTGTVTADGLTVDGTANITVGSGDNLTLTKATGSYLVFHDGTQKRAGINSLNTVDGMAFTTGTNTERMRITSTGQVGIGTSSPSTKLTVLANSANGIDLAQDPDNGTNSGRLFFTTSGGSNSIRSTSGALQFSTGATAGSSSGTERMRIDSSGNLLVGKTSTSFGTTGSRISNGFAEITNASDGALTLNRTGSDGYIARFFKSGTSVGSIGVSSDGASFGNATQHVAMHSGKLFPASPTHSALDNTIDLGYSGGRYKNLYLSGGVYLGGTGSANKLDDYEEGTFTPSILNGWGILNPTYSTNSGFYTKVGNIVHVAFRITLSGGSTNANGLRLNGLPFTVGATTNVGTNLSGWFATASSNAENVFLGLEANDVHPLFYYKNANGTSTFLGTDAGTGFSMTFSGTYQTDA